MAAPRPPFALPSCHCRPTLPSRVRYSPRTISMKSKKLHSPECPDCRVSPGRYHSLGCGIEQCPYCGGLLANCHDEDDPPPLDDRMPWTGERPGVAECRELGW